MGSAILAAVECARGENEWDTRSNTMDDGVGKLGDWSGRKEVEC